MKLSMEIPTALLKTISSLVDLDFILAQFVLEDPDYAEFFRKSTRFKILDNGFHERGEPLSLTEIAEAAERCAPNVVIAPDWLGDAARTYEGFTATKKKLGSAYKLGTVLQGKTREERVSFFNAVRSDTHLLCLPFKSERYSNFSELVDSTPKHIKWPPRIHLLGMKSLQEMKLFADLFNDLGISHRTSVDTGKLVKFGIAKQAIDEYTELRGKGLLDHNGKKFDSEQFANIFFNVAFARKYM
jgi:hypothetical protein